MNSGKKSYIIPGIGAAIMAFFLALSLFPSRIAPYGPKDMFQSWQGISPAHPLGTNDMGYDIFSELVFAASSTLSAGIAAAFISLIAGTVIGLLAGYAPRRRAEIFNIIITIFLQIPMLPAAIVIAAFLGPGRGNIILTIALLGWCPTARAVRAKTMQLKQSGFVEALKILDIPHFSILFRHLLPNLQEVVFARYIMSVSSCIMMEASLSFIGLGDTVRVTWGGMINFAFKRGGFVKGAFNWFLAPGLCITLCVLAFYCINVFFEERASTVDGPGQSYLD
jgi:peptide/nickel transport system permease protein